MAKGMACATIVWHHLVFYGPMSDVAQPLAPGLMAWLYEYGRMAVQVFLVLGGYLAAGSLAPQGLARFDHAGLQIARRFVRLVVPYAVALVVAVLAAALARPFMDHPSVPGDPSLRQLLANALLLQDIVGAEALSAGVWYVAIDFQLFSLMVLLFAGARSVLGRSGARWAAAMGRVLVVAGVAASLWWANLQADWDMWAVYFFGSYGLGVLACWAVRAADSRRAWGWAAVMVALGLIALAIEYRTRIAVALVTALLLAACMRKGVLAGFERGQWLAQLGQMSYSVFLIHFSICLVVNAVVSHFWPEGLWTNAVGMAAAFGLSLAAGRVLYEQIERHVPSWSQALRWQAGLVGTGLLVAATGHVL